MWNRQTHPSLTVKGQHIVHGTQGKLSAWNFHGLFFCLLFVSGCVGGPEPKDRTLLNSERIERQFGSYFIEILSQDSNRRLSNLYSLEDDQKTCRTFAVVEFQKPIPEAIAEEHELIVSGQSLGAVIKRHGWTITKEHRYVGEIDLTSPSSEIAQLMKITHPVSLGIHVYDLRVTKGTVNALYARIAEIHHPDYLTKADLSSIYLDSHQESSDESSSDIINLLKRINELISLDPSSPYRRPVESIPNG